MWVPDNFNQSQPQPQSGSAGNKPTSQKAATMATEPDEEKVEMVMAISNADRATAVRYLKAKHNNVEAAVNALLDGEDISQSEAATQWDESAWSTDRDGGSADQYLHPLGASSTAATRPNSPASSITRQSIRPATKTEEDEDLAKALQMSQNDARSVSGQQTGKIGPHGQESQLVPAGAKEYKEGEWAIVPFSLSESTDEVVPDLDAPDRVNQAGQPRLLKQLPEGDYLPAFLTIAHAISGAREALLMRDHIQTDYGKDPDWWKGHSIVLPKVVHLDNVSPAVPESDFFDDLIIEVQRLMAFLDNSNRSYASIGSLCQTDIMKNTNFSSARSRTLLEFFIKQWTAAATSKVSGDGSLKHLFTTTVGTNAPDGMVSPDMNLVDLPVSLGENERSDLFERLDDLLWDTDAESEAMSDNYIEHPADVVVMRLYQQSTAESQLRVEVPAEFYVDKYLLENVEAMKSTRVQMSRGKQRIAKIEEIEKKLTKWTHPRTNAGLDAKALLEYTVGHFSGKNRDDVLKAERSFGSATIPETELNDPPHYEDIVQKLEKTMADIEDKLQLLSQEKERTRKAVAEMSRVAPPEMSSQAPRHRYTLRGVATKPNITYVLRPAENHDSEIEDLEDDNTPDGMQWWRLEYEVNASGLSAKVRKTKALDYDVLRAVELEHRSALLVYASDEIQVDTFEELPLPLPLQEFIEQDSKLFAQELSQDHSKPPAYSFDMTDVSRDDVRDSIEGRDSMDSTRVEGTGSDVGEPHSPPKYNDEIFDKRPDFGLGYDIKQGEAGADDEPPVHEIRLPDDEGLGLEIGTEMVEKPHQPLYAQTNRSDATMQDLDSQDSGVGGATHMEDVEKST